MVDRVPGEVEIFTQPLIKVPISPELWSIKDDQKRKRRIIKYLNGMGMRAVKIEKPYVLCERRGSNE